MKLKTLVTLICTIWITLSHTHYLIAQDHHFWNHKHFTKADTLRGQLSAERSCFDVKHYDLNIQFDMESQTIEGFNAIRFDLVKSSERMQIDLFQNMSIDSIIYEDQTLSFSREYNAVFIDIKNIKNLGEHTIYVYYQGKPREAINPPWDGGFCWDKDREKRLWMSVSCEGVGASLWWPNKDHLSDEPDSMDIHYTLENEYSCVSNGQLISKESSEHLDTYHWKVSYPINNYNVTFYIGQYAAFFEEYYCKSGDTLALSYYVLDYNLAKARKHFKQVKGVLEAYEHYLGPYPFMNDGFKLVEAPYLGMEHQSAIAYGNEYMRGYLGGLIPRNQDWDYIIVHETGHEYFGNSLSCNDHADMWIHESFTTYLEALYVEYTLGKSASLDHLIQERIFENKEPIIGPHDVNFGDWVASDHYFKGSWVLHTLRHVIDNDELWFSMVRGLYEKYAFSNVSNEEIFDWFEEKSGLELSAFFEQYLKRPSIPKLALRNIDKLNGSVIFEAKWDNVIEGFSLPVGYTKVNEDRITITDEWQRFQVNIPANKFNIDNTLYLFEK